MSLVQARYQKQVAGSRLRRAEFLEHPLGLEGVPNAPPGMPGADAGQAPEGPQDASQGQSGQEGEMIPGPCRQHKGMPSNSTVSPENAQSAPTEGIPPEMQSPLTMGMQGGGFNLLHLARRAATAVAKLTPLSRLLS